MLRLSRPAALGVAGIVLISWLVPQVRLDFYRDSELTLLALGGAACLGGALIAFRELGTEVGNLRLDLADGRVDRYQRKAPELGATGVGQASILPRSRLEVGLGGRRSEVENLPLSDEAKFEKVVLSLLRHPASSDSPSRPMTATELAEIKWRHAVLDRRLTRRAAGLGALILISLGAARGNWGELLVLFLAIYIVWFPTLLVTLRLRADRRAGMILRGRSGGPPAIEWEILPRSQFLWSEQGQAARWRSEVQENETKAPDSVAPGDRDLRKRMGKEWVWIRPALRSPRALWAVLPIGCLALSIAAFWAMPADPTPSQFGAPFLWAAATLLGGSFLFFFLQDASNEPLLSAVETGESSVPRSKEPAPPTGEAFRRTLLLSERDQIARLISSQTDSGARVASPTIVLGWVLVEYFHPPDRWWTLGLALFVLSAPVLVSGLRSAWSGLQLRRDLRDGTVTVGRYASESGEIEWLARSRFAWTEDSEPVAWRAE